jgi:RNA recognition motif-containing protein
MGKKLFVGNLSFDTTSADLTDLFSKVGTCESATVITDRATGRSRGFGFVEMSSASEAQAAIAELNGKELHGRTLNVNEANERPSGGGGGRGGFGGGGGRGRGGGGGGGGFSGGKRRF